MMFGDFIQNLGSPLLATVKLWYGVPLILATSLVYGATRHEKMAPIIEHAIRFALWILTFMAGIFAVTWLLTRFI